MNGGIVDRLAIMGSSDPSRFLTRFPGNQRAGNYCIEHTPHEVAVVIACVRGMYRPIRRVLVVGSNTLGAERAIAEAVGAMEVDWVRREPVEDGSDFDRNLGGLDLSGIRTKEGIGDDYDLILLSGDAEIDCNAIHGLCKVGTMVASLGCGSRMGWKNQRAAWHWFRSRGFHVLTQTGSGSGEMGVGVVNITYKRVDDDPVSEAPSGLEEGLLTTKKHGKRGRK